MNKFRKATERMLVMRRLQTKHTDKNQAAKSYMYTAQSSANTFQAAWLTSIATLSLAGLVLEAKLNALTVSGPRSG